jgi:hypothetical protein
MRQKKKTSSYTIYIYSLQEYSVQIIFAYTHMSTDTSRKKRKRTNDTLLSCNGYNEKNIMIDVENNLGFSSSYFLLSDILYTQKRDLQTVFRFNYYSKMILARPR